MTPQTKLLANHCFGAIARITLATVIFSLMVIGVSPVQAQSYTVLHNFTGGTDGANPYAGLTLDAAGNLYGTAASGGIISGYDCCGTVYKLVHHSGGWTFSTLYSFGGNGDGFTPQARVVFGPDSLLYGTTLDGGASGYGTVYKLQPRPNICASISCEWVKTTLYSFGNYPDAQLPAAGDVVFDSTSNLYGATYSGGSIQCFDGENPGCGAVYQLTPSAGGWQESVIYNLVAPDGATPNGVAFDSSGHLEGTTSIFGPDVAGTVFSLSPNGQGQWDENTLYGFSGGQDGGAPKAGVIFDGAGNLYGTTSLGGSGNGGTVWQLTSSGLNTLVSFNYSGSVVEPGSTAVLTIDAAGDLYGTTLIDGAHNQGSVFKLTPSDGGWTLTTLYSFTGGVDGGQPHGQVILDAEGNIYGTASVGGSTVGQCNQQLGCGVVWEITP